MNFPRRLSLLAAAALVGGTSSYAAGHTAPDVGRAVTESRCRSGAYIHQTAGPTEPKPEAARTGLPASVAPSTSTPGFDRSIVSVTFDGSSRSIHDTALPIMRRYGIASTDYLTTGDLGRSKAFMTPADVYDLRAAGHEIASHAVSNTDLTAASDSELDRQLTTSKHDLERCFGPTDDFASPAGATNPAVTEQIDRRYHTSRSLDSGFNTPANLDPNGLLVQVVGRDTSPGQISAWLSSTSLTGTWLILVYDRVDGTGRSPSDFAHDMQAIKASGMATLTVHQAFEELSLQPAR